VIAPGAHDEPPRDARHQTPRDAHGHRIVVPDRAPESRPEPAFTAATPPHGFYRHHGKRWFDFGVTFVCTLIALPFILLLALTVLVTSGRPILFLQERVGLHGRIFRIWKFRSMVVDAHRHEQGYYLQDKDPRITWCGRWMRALSLDELPQVFNVLKGDMSLVGPRPNLEFVVDEYRPLYESVLSVRPGLTGYVAIRGRNRLRRSEMLRWDQYYVDTLSFGNDLRIIGETVPSVLFRRGSTNDVSKEFLEDLGQQAGPPPGAPADAAPPPDRPATPPPAAPGAP
jgi:lipopolysaccharide/colanic/teichoic acid biosynthesis glycosyltransferase